MLFSVVSLSGEHSRRRRRRDKKKKFAAAEPWQ
jgi:hypothetical protein